MWAVAMERTGIRKTQESKRTLTIPPQKDGRSSGCSGVRRERDNTKVDALLNKLIEIAKDAMPEHHAGDD